MSQSSYDLVYGINEIEKKLQEGKQYYIDYLELLENVRFCRKKDGTEFQNINKNFENGKVLIDSFSDSFHPVFQVSGYTKSGKYQSYKFDAYIYESDLPKDDIRREECVSAASFMRKTYILTVSEIEERISEQKQFCKDHIAHYNRQLGTLEVIFPKVQEKLKELKDLIEEGCKEVQEKPFKSSLEYALQDYIRTNIR